MELTAKENVPGGEYRPASFTSNGTKAEPAHTRTTPGPRVKRPRSHSRRAATFPFRVDRSAERRTAKIPRE